jgi:hypothetical protein
MHTLFCLGTQTRHLCRSQVPMHHIPSAVSQPLPSEVADAFADSVRGRKIIMTKVGLGEFGSTTAKALAAHSPNLLVFAVLSSSKVNVVIDEIQQSNLTANCRFCRWIASWLTTMLTPSTFSRRMWGCWTSTDGLRTLSPEEDETQFAANQIGHFVFTNLIVARLISAAVKKTP